MKTTISVRENISLADYTTLKIGGAARYFVRAETEQQVVDAFGFSEKNNFNVFVLGGGSNVLIADDGFDGLVLQIALKGIEVAGEFVTAQAGEDWDEFCAFCVERNLAGIECLSGIPGFVGGTPVQNVGAYGQEVSETIVKVRLFDRKSKEITELENADCRFAYRSSIFNTIEKNRFVVLAVTFKLKVNGSPKIVYKDLQQYFENKNPTLQQAREAVISIRRAKSMVVDERDANSKSAGSFFKNPIVSKKKYEEISKKVGQTIPYYSVDEHSVKIPAAWLIENAGFKKGYRKANVGLSSKHTLAIINTGNASAREIIALKNEIQKEVQRNFDILLKPEPIFVGF